VIAEKDFEAGRDVEQEIAATGGEAAFIQTDVSSPGDVEKLMKKTVERFAAIHILINNAGISIWKKPGELSVEQWDEVVNTNLRGAFVCLASGTA